MEANDVHKIRYQVRLVAGSFFAILGFIAGAVILFTAAGKLWNAHMLSDSGVHTDGTILQVTQKLKGNKVLVLISYRLTDGREKEFVTIANTDLVRQTNLPVVYSKDRPETVSLDSWKSLWSGGIILFAFGCVFILFSLLIASTLYKETWPQLLGTKTI